MVLKPYTYSTFSHPETKPGETFTPDPYKPGDKHGTVTFLGTEPIDEYPWQNKEVYKEAGIEAHLVFVVKHHDREGDVTRDDEFVRRDKTSGWETTHRIPVWAGPCQKVKVRYRGMKWEGETQVPDGTFHEGELLVWNWDRNVDAPTMSPSLLSGADPANDPDMTRFPRFHCFLRRGKIDLLSDSNLALVE